MHKSILKIILILCIVLHICHVKSQVVNEIDNVVELDFDETDNGENGKSNTGEDVTTNKVSESLVEVTVTTTETHTTITNSSTEVTIMPTDDITSSLGVGFFVLSTTTTTTTPREIVKTPTNDPKSTPNNPKIPKNPSPNSNPTPTPTPAPSTIISKNLPIKSPSQKEEDNKIAPVTTLKTDDYNGGEINVDNSGVDNNPGDNSNKNEGVPFYEKMGTVVLFVGTVSVGLVAVSGYQVYKRKNEKGFKQKEYVSHSLTNSSLTPSDVSDNNPRISISQSLIFDNESQNQAYDMYYSAKSLEENEQQKEQRIVNVDTLTYQSPKPRPQSQVSIESATSKTDSIGRNSLDRNSLGRISLERNSLGRNSTRSTISRNSVIRHSFLNPNIRIVRTGKRTQQLFEATNEHPAIIETFPSMERPFEPAVPVPLEESDTNSLHPHSIYQMCQEEMEFENYYAYTIDDKEYIIDPTTNRVLEIHDLTTDEYVLVEEELYLDFSGSDDSDSDKQTLWFLRNHTVIFYFNNFIIVIRN